MTTATMTSKGQITIPASVRAAMSLDAGTKVEFVELENGEYKIVPINRSVKRLKGMFAHKALSKPVTIEKMNISAQMHVARLDSQRNKKA
jgi:antitoxin PrlF